MKSAAIGLPGKLLRKPWYMFWRAIERLFYRGREYTLSVPFGQRIFTPWFASDGSSEFARLLRTVKAVQPLLVSADRCHILYQLCRASLDSEGDLAECGVYTGGTAHLLSILISEHAQRRKLHLFDSFQGMPPASLAKRDYHAPGEFSDTSLTQVKHRLSEFPFVVFHPGFMPKTFEEVESVPRYAFVHVDVDIYPSVLDCCKWFWPRLSRGGVMLFDDYGFYPYRHAARAAVDEFFSAFPQSTPLILPTGQAVVFKR